MALVRIKQFLQCWVDNESFNELISYFLISTELSCVRMLRMVRAVPTAAKRGGFADEGAGFGGISISLRSG